MKLWILIVLAIYEVESIVNPYPNYWMVIIFVWTLFFIIEFGRENDGN